MVPAISNFYGVTILMYWDDHSPPHFHARYAETTASITIQTLLVLHGDLPRRALALTLEWALEHQGELIENWDLCAQKQLPKRIPPLK